MKKRQPKCIREIKQKVAQNIRKQKRIKFSNVLTKDKVETFDDIISIFNGLSRRAKDSAVLSQIHLLVRLEKSPNEIIKILEPKA